MHTHDARALSPKAQEDLRRRVVRGVMGGLGKAQASRVFGVSRTAVHNWTTVFKTGGTRALRARRRGRPKVSRLAPHEAATTVCLITDRCPDQLKLPFVLWTREAVQQLLGQRFDMHVSVWTVGRYLRKWGLTPQKPLRRAYEQDPQAVRRWLAQDYPAIRHRATREQAQLYWGDEMGLRSDHQAGRSYGRRGRTPVVPGTGQRFRCQMLSAVTNRGQLAFMVFTQRFTAAVMLAFLRRLRRHSRRKVFLIVDRHPVHRSTKVTRWLAQQRRQLELFFLPPYSPELNPDELLNQDVKTNAVGRWRPRDQTEMMAHVRSYLRSTQRQPAVIRSYFQEAHVAYAAA